MMKHKLKKKQEGKLEAEKEKVGKVENGRIEISKKEYEELKEKLRQADERFEILAGAKAEFENAKKRAEREKSEFVKFANDGLISKLLPVLDNFRRAVEASCENHSVEDVLAGIKLIDKQFEDVLKDFGLTLIDALGKKFDPHCQQAVAYEDTDKYEDEVVMEELQKGYLLNGRLLRPAMVKVAKKIEAHQEKKEEKGQQKMED
ncbi:MAG: nucleotide exchange factor GrpE [Candidatus Omnitrophica bacterium]|nr:nucleotide exchange factor GrpE [Candidatus Omnitrophota bacterium]